MPAATIHHGPDFTDMPNGEGTPPVEVLRAHLVDEHLVIGDGIARASLWWRHAPPLPSGRLGVIGHYEARDDATAAALLETAADRLRHEGCTHAVGPMDGTTWRRYRFVTWRGDEPRFALEPDNPDAWPRQWLAAGFAPREAYISSVVDDLGYRDSRLDVVAERLGAAGVALRELDVARLTDELERIYAVSEVAFRGNVLYTPLARPEFLAMYASVAPLLQPGLSFIAERNGKAVGFVFALPDVERRRRGVPVDTVVVKTLAILPGRDLAGLGKLLLDRCHGAARVLGYRRAIHALMHVANSSTRMGHEARVIRRYELFERPLT